MLSLRLLPGLTEALGQKIIDRSRIYSPHPYTFQINKNTAYRVLQGRCQDRIRPLKNINLVVDGGGMILWNQLFTHAVRDDLAKQSKIVKDL